jgi:hypothetical protein
VRPIAALMMAVVGVLVFSVLLLGDIGLLPSDRSTAVPWSLVIRYAVAMAIGGALAGAVLADLFGRAGVGGWLLSLLGGALASVVAGFLGSAVGLAPDLLRDGLQPGDLIAIGFGAFLAPIALLESWGHLAVWFALVALTHLLCAKARRPRQSA